MLESIFSSPSGWGLLILRLALGITFIVHGWPKLNPNGQLKGPAGLAGWLKQMGVPLPLFFAWVVALLETLGAVLLILGLGTFILAAGSAIDMLVATMLVKRQMMKAAFMDQKVQGWEFEFALMVQAVTLLFTGAGSISLDRVLGIAVPDAILLPAGAGVLIVLAVLAILLNRGPQSATSNQTKTA